MYLGKRLLGVCVYSAVQILLVGLILRPFGVERGELDNARAAFLVDLENGVLRFVGAEAHSAALDGGHKLAASVEARLNVVALVPEYEAVVVDGNIITSRGMGTAIPFSLVLIEQLLDAETAEKFLNEVDYFTDTEKNLKGMQRPEFMTLAPNSITKVRVYVWIEGQDVDNYDFAQLGSAITVNFGFTKERFTDEDVSYSESGSATLPDDVKVKKN